MGKKCRVDLVRDFEPPELLRGHRRRRRRTRVRPDWSHQRADRVLVGLSLSSCDAGWVVQYSFSLRVEREIFAAHPLRSTQTVP